MMMRNDHFDESTVEQAAKEWLAEIGFHTGYAPVDAAVEDVRDSLGDCILWSHVANALTRLNPAFCCSTNSARGVTRRHE